MNPMRRLGDALRSPSSAMSRLMASNTVAHLNCARRAQDAGKHGYALLGEGVGAIGAAAT
jgi:hypothetical protein